MTWGLDSRVNIASNLQTTFFGLATMVTGQRKGRALKYFHTQSTVYPIIIPNFEPPRRVSFLISTAVLRQMH